MSTYRRHTHSSSNFLKANEIINCKRYSLTLTRANTDLLPTKSFVTNKRRQTMPVNNFRSSSVNDHDLSSSDNSILNKSVDLQLDNSLTKSTESLRTETKQANTLHQENAGSFTMLKRNSITINNSNLNSASAYVNKKQNKSSNMSRNRINSNVQIVNDSLSSNRYAITASLSNDAQYAMFKAYEDLLYQELKRIYPDIDAIILTKKFNMNNNNTSQVDEIDGNKNKEEIRKLKISKHIQTGIKILDLVRKLNKENKKNNNNNAITNTTSSCTNNNSTNMVSFNLINDNTGGKRRSSALLNKSQTKQLLTNVTNSTTITVIDESDEFDKSTNELFNEKDPLGLYIKWIGLLHKDYFI
jgi:hypothetical protein